MRLDYLSPLPPVRSGVSEYSVDLLPVLARGARVRLFAAPPAGGEAAGLAVEPPEAFDRAVAGGEGGDLAVYHMGNNTHHAFVAERAARVPGLLVLHDLVLHHFWVEETLSRGREEEYVALMERVYGEVGRGAGTARAHEVSSQVEYFAFPLFETLAAASRGVLVHNRRAERLVRERVAGLPVAVAPMGIPHSRADALPPREAARAALGVPPGDLLVGLFGFMTPIKRPVAALRAFAAAARRLPHARLVVVGEVSRTIDLAGEARALGVAGRLTLAGYVPYEEAKRWVAATDVFLNLRYPTAGETSASLLRLLGWGKAVVVSEYAQFRELPREVALRVSLGPAEEHELVEVLALLAGWPELRARLGAAAARHVEQEHSLERAAAAYLGFAAELHAGGAGARGRILPFPAARTSRTPRHPAVAIEALPLPARVPPGARLLVRALLRNTGDTTWLRRWAPEAGYATFGVYEWDRAAGPSRELGASALPRDVAPGESVEVSCAFRAPEREGPVDLVVDVRILGWGFLHQRGSPANVYRVEVSDRV